MFWCCDLGMIFRGILGDIRLLEEDNKKWFEGIFLNFYYGLCNM